MTAIIFDLDYTLYDAGQYYLGAFREISEVLSKEHLLPKEEIYEKLVEIWRKKTSMYPHLFDSMANFFKIDVNVERIVRLFNEYRGKLKPYPETIPVLKFLRRKGYKLGLVTDGNPKRQKRKAALLGIRKFFDVEVYTEESGPKSSPSPFLKALDKLGENPRNSFYVGDNPMLDFEGAKKAGIKTVRILKGEFAKLPKSMYIDFEIKNLREIIKIKIDC